MFLEFWNKQRPTFYLYGVVLLTVSIISKFSFRLVTVTLRLLMLFEDTFRQRRTIQHKRGSGEIVVRPFVWRGLSVDRASGIFSTVTTSRGEAYGGVYVSMGPIEQRAIGLPKIITSGTGTVSPQATAFGVATSGLLRYPWYIKGHTFLQMFAKLRVRRTSFVFAREVRSVSPNLIIDGLCILISFN